MLVEFKNIGRNHIYETIELRDMRAIRARLDIYLMDEAYELIKMNKNLYRVVQGSTMAGVVKINAT